MRDDLDFLYWSEFSRLFFFSAADDPFLLFPARPRKGKLIAPVTVKQLD
jgi:hypothetical protein